MSDRKWNKASVISELRRLQSAGEDIRPSALNLSAGGLYNAGRRLFGSTLLMYEAAGLDLDKIGPIRTKRDWSPQLTLQRIKEREKAGLSLNIQQVLRHDSSLFRNAERFFGSWSGALNAAGIEYSKYHKKKPQGYWTETRIISEIARLAKEGRDLSRLEVARDFPGLVSIADQKMAGWYRAIELAGFDRLKFEQQKPKGYWNEKSIVEQISALHDNGEDLSYASVRQNHLPLTSAAERLFGNWYNATEAAGIPIEKIQRRKTNEYWTKEVIKNAIIEMKDNGEDLSGTSVSKKNSKLHSAAIRSFGGWYNALEASGISSKDIRKQKPAGYWTKTRIIDMIRDFQTRGQPLNAQHINKNHRALYSESLIHFTSWNKALEAAGVNREDVAIFNKWSKEKVIQTIKTLHDQGEDLSLTHMKQTQGRLLGIAITTYFGTWENAIEAAGFDYGQIRRNWYLETFKGTLFEKHVLNMLRILKYNIEYQKHFVFHKERCIPDFYDLDSGMWIDAKLGSWGSGTTTSMLEKYLNHTPNLKIIYLKGRRRKWKDDTVQFIPVKQFYPELSRVGATELIKSFELLRRGILTEKEQSSLERFISSLSRKESDEIKRMSRKALPTSVRLME